MTRQRWVLGAAVTFFAAASLASGKPWRSPKTYPAQADIARIKFFPQEPRKVLHLEFEVSPRLSQAETDGVLVDVWMDAKVRWVASHAWAPSVLQSRVVAENAYLQMDVLRPGERIEISLLHRFFLADTEVVCDAARSRCLASVDFELWWHRASGGIVEVDPNVRLDALTFDDSAVDPTGLLRLASVTVVPAAR